MKKENWNNITNEPYNRFVYLSKIGGKKDLIKQLKSYNLSYTDAVQELMDRTAKVGKIKNTYYWIDG